MFWSVCDLVVALLSQLPHRILRYRYGDTLVSCSSFVSLEFRPEIAKGSLRTLGLVLKGLLGPQGQADK